MSLESNFYCLLFLICAQYLNILSHFFCSSLNIIAMLSVQSKICYKGFRLTEYSKRNKVYFVSSLGILAESYVLVKNIIFINCITVSVSLRISTFLWFVQSVEKSVPVYSLNTPGHPVWITEHLMQVQLTWNNTEGTSTVRLLCKSSRAL